MISIFEKVEGEDRDAEERSRTKKFSPRKSTPKTPQGSKEWVSTQSYQQNYSSQTFKRSSAINLHEEPYFDNKISSITVHDSVLSGIVNNISGICSSPSVFVWSKSQTENLWSTDSLLDVNACNPTDNVLF